MGENAFSKENIAKAKAAFEVQPAKPAPVTASASVATPTTTPTSGSQGQPTKTVDPKGLTPGQRAEFKAAGVRAEESSKAIQDAKVQAELNKQVARAFSKQVAATNTADSQNAAIAKSRMLEAETKGDEAIRQAEEGTKTELRGDKGTIGIPKAPKGVDVRAAAARIIAKRREVDNNLKSAEKKRDSKIRQLVKARQAKQASTYPAAMEGRPTAPTPDLDTRIEGLEAEVDQLDEYTENLDNLDLALEAIQTRTLGTPPQIEKDVAAEEAKLEGKPTEFDPEESVRAAAKAAAESTSPDGA